MLKNDLTSETKNVYEQKLQLDIISLSGIGVSTEAKVNVHFQRLHRSVLFVIIFFTFIGIPVTKHPLE